MTDKAKHWLTKPRVSPVPIEKSADFEMDRQRGFAKFSLPMGGSVEQNALRNRLLTMPNFEDVGTTRKPKKAAEAPTGAASPSESAMCF